MTNKGLYIVWSVEMMTFFRHTFQNGTLMGSAAYLLSLWWLASPSLGGAQPTSLSSFKRAAQRTRSLITPRPAAEQRHSISLELQSRNSFSLSISVSVRLLWLFIIIRWEECFPLFSFQNGNNTDCPFPRQLHSRRHFSLQILLQCDDSGVCFGSSSEPHCDLPFHLQTEILEDQHQQYISLQPRLGWHSAAHLSAWRLPTSWGESEGVKMSRYAKPCSSCCFWTEEPALPSSRSSP